MNGIERTWNGIERTVFRAKERINDRTTTRNTGRKSIQLHFFLVRFCRVFKWVFDGVKLGEAGSKFSGFAASVNRLLLLFCGFGIMFRRFFSKNMELKSYLFLLLILLTAFLLLLLH